MFLKDVSSAHQAAFIEQYLFYYYFFNTVKTVILLQFTIIAFLKKNILSNVLYPCDGKAEFSVSHDPSEIIPIS